jgi:hypothetical protein
MERKILTYPMERRQLQEELDFMVQYLTGKGVKTCEVLFGYAWGVDYYPGNEWLEEEIQLNKLAEKIREVEASGIGALGEDDLFIKMLGLEFQFCHESDVHIYFNEPNNNDIEFYYSRWKKLGYQPAEWIKNQTNAPGERVRFN